MSSLWLTREGGRRRSSPSVLALVLASCGGSEEADPDLILVSTRDGEYALFGMSASGSDEQRLTDAEVDPSTPQGLLFQTEPAWSPDGSTIAFVSKRSGTSDLYAMNEDGSGTRRLTSTKDDDAQPSWSPDGEADRLRPRHDRPALRHERRWHRRSPPHRRRSRRDRARHGHPTAARSPTCTGHRGRASASSGSCGRTARSRAH